jgi:hypothetical protein
MAHLLDEELDRRLRATRPPLAEPDEALLQRVLAEPRPRAPRRARVIAPVATLAAAAAAAFVLFAGGSNASAIEQAMHWFDPPAGSILHTHLSDTNAGVTTDQEFWGVADDITRSRIRYGGAYEVSGDGIYDVAANTIYEPATEGRAGKGDVAAADVKKRAQTQADGKQSQQDESGRVPEKDIPQSAGDPIVAKVRTLLALGHAEVRGRAVYDGHDAWVIGLKPGIGGPDWKLYVSADDGKPLGLHDPGRGNDAPEDAKWSTYEIAPPDTPLTLAAAHPGARVVRDNSQYTAAMERFTHGKLR